MAGWIALHKGIEDHWLWKSKEPFDTRSAWIDLLIQANFTDFKTQYKMKLVERKRGEVNVSYRYLAERWRWDRRKVKRFLELLEGDEMVSVHSTTDGTTITIENYDKWQNKRTIECTIDSTTDSTTDGTTHVPMITRQKQDLNKTKQKRGRFTPPTLSEVEDYIKEKNYHVDAEQFINFYESKGWYVGKNKMKSWKACIATWEKRHKDQQKPTQPQTRSINTVFEEIFEEHKNDI